MLHQLETAPTPTEETCIRLLDTGDLCAFEQHLKGLSESSRRSRFLTRAPEPFIEAYVQNFYASASIAFGLQAAGQLHGVAELRSDGVMWSDRAEVAVSVADAWQGLGMGRALIATAIQAASTRDIKCVSLHFQTSNARMMRIARELAGSIKTAGAECTASITVQSTPHASMPA